MLSEKQWKTSIKYLGYKNLKEFQKAYKLTADNKYGPKTDAKLELAVLVLKNRLRNLLKCKLDYNGIVGVGTKNAIKKAQKKLKLKVDTIAGVKTKKALGISISHKDIFSFQNKNGTINWSKVPYFKKSEFKCHCNGKYCKGYEGKEINPWLLFALINSRKKYGVIVVTSGKRCKRYNNTLKGSSKVSKHLTFDAADICCKGTTKNKFMSYMKKQPHYHYTYTNSTNMGNAIHVDFSR
ncbi:D-Ala-D-Ala carboxypeptidase family metallohydrolase [Anaerofustis stercorihominis]|uniref:D-Ala-D-Ala carboxypeptidase family metallohydrolase n=1 Tax=Anaerofustis stercorihominis TaxID=214853 RepID=UPI00214AB3A1|nr:peptidoglycan-binding protein [Anaerofustis stercorihominis]MCR2033723.1 D-Ala-D-Ala carboxypeptidase family metallohydrolase [Anaerofustis stercorihominis]